jgi:hypothetical protein
MVGSVQPLRLSVEPCEIEQKGPRTNTEKCRLPQVSKIRLRPSCNRPAGFESGGPFCFCPPLFRAALVSWRFSQHRIGGRPCLCIRCVLAFWPGKLPVPGVLSPKPRFFRHERKASVGMGIRKTVVFRHARVQPQKAVKTAQNAYGKPCWIAAVTGNRALTFTGGIFWGLGLDPRADRLSLADFSVVIISYSICSECMTAFQGVNRCD